MTPPSASMSAPSPEELTVLCKQNIREKKYTTSIEKESATDILLKKYPQNTSGTDTDSKYKAEKETSPASPFGKAITKIRTKTATTVAKSVGNALIRGILGKLGIPIDKRRTFF